MICEDDDELGYWTGSKPRRWWEKPQHGGYPDCTPEPLYFPNSPERTAALLEQCFDLIGGREIAAEIECAAMMAMLGHDEDAERCRHFAGYGGLS